MSNNERGITDSETTVGMKPDPNDFARYEIGIPTRTLEMGNWTLITAAGYGYLLLQFKHSEMDGGNMCKLTLTRAAQVSEFRYNLFSVAQLLAIFQHPMQLWLRAAASRRPRNGPELLGARAMVRQYFVQTACGVCLG